MAAGSIVELDGIPFFDLSQASGKFFSALTFYDEGDWRIWISLGEGKYIESKAWTCEGFYYGRSAERKTDFNLHFLNFIAQRASYMEIMKPLTGLQDDLFNLSASLAKISHIHKTKDLLGGGDGRMVITEIEYVFSICRSMIDLFQEIVEKLWDKVRLYGDSLPQKKKLRKSFSEMVWYKDRLSTREEIQARFGLPAVWADFYMRHAEFFFHIKRFRDRIIHNGSQVQTIFSGSNGYLVTSDFKPFSGMDIWDESDKLENNLVPLMPALGLVAYKTILMCDDFSSMLEETLEFQSPLVPDMNLYMRGFFDEHFVEVLVDAECRYLRGLENIITN